MGRRTDFKCIPGGQAGRAANFPGICLAPFANLRSTFDMAARIGICICHKRWPIAFIPPVDLDPLSVYYSRNQRPLATLSNGPNDKAFETGKQRR
jgi:hypothetical protein